MKEFQINEYTLKKLKNLKKQKGILAELDPKKGETADTGSDPEGEIFLWIWWIFTHVSRTKRV